MTVMLASVSWNAFFVAVAAAVGTGAVYALVALGFTLVYSATGYFHLGIGAFVTLGAVGAYVGAVTLGLPWVVVFIVVIIIGGVLGVGSELIAVRPIRGRAWQENNAVVVSTLAFLTIIGQIIALWFGPTDLPVPPYFAGPSFVISGVPIRRIYVMMAVVLIVITVLFELVMRRTDVGRILRASHDDATGVELAGINFERVVRLTFCLAGAFAALAGVLVAPVSYASAYVGLNLLLYGFAAITIGGFGSFTGALVGGLVVGLVTSLSPLVFSPYLTSPMVLLVMVAVLLVKPKGLFGQAELRAV